MLFIKLVTHQEDIQYKVSYNLIRSTINGGGNQMKKANLKYGLIALAGLGMSANANALTCNDITFSAEAFAAYEFVDRACLEIVDRGGKTFAKMTARVVDQTPGGTQLRYMHSDGTRGPRHKSVMPKNFVLHLGGKAVMLKDLVERQDINVYVSDEFWSAPAAAPAAAAAPPPPPPPPAPAPEPEPEPMALPTTAGPLPWLALFGSLFLILGGALRFSRK
jgi:hypothetical protein